MLRAHGVDVPEAEELPPCPAEFEHILGWFEELSAQRRHMPPIVTMREILPAPLHPLVWDDMNAWASQMGHRPHRGEWRLIMQLDMRFRDAQARRLASRPRPPRR